MSVRDYKQLASVLKDELNGRYMMAEEARRRFDDIEKKIDEKKDVIAHLAESIDKIVQQNKN